MPLANTMLDMNGQNQIFMTAISIVQIALYVFTFFVFIHDELAVKLVCSGFVLSVVVTSILYTIYKNRNR